MSLDPFNNRFSSASAPYTDSAQDGAVGQESGNSNIVTAQASEGHIPQSTSGQGGVVVQISSRSIEELPTEGGGKRFNVEEKVGADAHVLIKFINDKLMSDLEVAQANLMELVRQGVKYGHYKYVEAASKVDEAKATIATAYKDLQKEFDNAIEIVEKKIDGLNQGVNDKNKEVSDFKKEIHKLQEIIKNNKKLIDENDNNNSLDDSKVKKLTEQLNIILKISQDPESCLGQVIRTTGQDYKVGLTISPDYSRIILEQSTNSINHSVNELFQTMQNRKASIQALTEESKQCEKKIGNLEDRLSHVQKNMPNVDLQLKCYAEELKQLREHQINFRVREHQINFI